MTDLDSDRDDVPRRFRRTSSCGPERTCGAEDCSTCYPNGVVEEDADDDEEPNADAHFAQVSALLGALKIAVTRPGDVNAVVALVSRTQRALVIALEKLDEERLTDLDEAAFSNRIYHEWHRRMLAAEAELVTLRHVHRPPAVSE